jgi:hypothetical protein
MAKIPMPQPEMEDPMMEAPAGEMGADGLPMPEETAEEAMDLSGIPDELLLEEVKKRGLI